MKKDIRAFVQKDRHDFEGDDFTEESAGDNPYKLFEQWLSDALACSVPDPSAFTLATASKEGIPSARVVYMRDFSPKGLVCYTNYGSNKSQDMEGNPMFCGNFYWQENTRQVRFSGSVERVSDEESDYYFKFRPRESQLGAWASKQSQELDSRATLEKKLAYYDEKFGTDPVPRPPFWGGYLLKPSQIEFWQGRESRLHDRLVFKLNQSGDWNRQRVSP